MFERQTYHDASHIKDILSASTSILMSCMHLRMAACLQTYLGLSKGTHIAAQSGTWDDGWERVGSRKMAGGGGGAHVFVAAEYGSVKDIGGSRPHRLLLSAVETAANKAVGEAGDGLVQKRSGGVACTGSGHHIEHALQSISSNFPFAAVRSGMLKASWCAEAVMLA